MLLIQNAVPEACITIFRLYLKPSLIEERIRLREKEKGFKRNLRRALELSEVMSKNSIGDF